MNIELARVEQRSARFAALADPLRLRIVDALALSDLSPSELQQQLGTSSNLLAHHLSVLEDAGLVERGRSEGDRRRSYVRLVSGGLEGLLPSSTVQARRVVFVCTANSARSQLAAALWSARSSVPAISAGTHPAERIDPGAIDAAERHGLEPLTGAPVALPDVADAGDFVITVCDTAHEELAAGSTLHWSIPDPVRAGTADAFDLAFETIARRIDELAPRLQPA